MSGLTIVRTDGVAAVDGAVAVLAPLRDGRQITILAAT